MAAFDFIFKKKSIFAASAAYSPRKSILSAAYQCAQPPSVFEEYFALSQSRIMVPAVRSSSPNAALNNIPAPGVKSEPLSKLMLEYARAGNFTYSPDTMAFVSYTDAAIRLSPLLSLCSYPHSTDLPVQSGDTCPVETRSPGFPILHDIARYAFSFPVRSGETFASLVRENDTRALLILLYFYRAVNTLLPRQRYWWRVRRSEFMEDSIERELESRRVDLLPLGPADSDETGASGAGAAVQRRQQLGELEKAARIRVTHEWLNDGYFVLINPLGWTIQENKT